MSCLLHDTTEGSQNAPACVNTTNLDNQEISCCVFLICERQTGKCPEYRVWRFSEFVCEENKTAYAYLMQPFNLEAVKGRIWHSDVMS